MAALITSPTVGETKGSATDRSAFSRPDCDPQRALAFGEAEETGEVEIESDELGREKSLKKGSLLK